MAIDECAKWHYIKSIAATRPRTTKERAEMLTPFAPHQCELDKLKALRRQAEQANVLLGWPVMKGGKQ